MQRWTNRATRCLDIWLAETEYREAKISRICREGDMPSAVNALSRYVQEQLDMAMEEASSQLRPQASAWLCVLFDSWDPEQIDWAQSVRTYRQ
jgi:hypothetical protein